MGNLTEYFVLLFKPALSRLICSLPLAVIATVFFTQLAAHAVNAPVITPGTGVYATKKTSVTITADPGDTIYFTSDGSVPTTGSTVYSSPIAIGDTATIKAIAWNSGVSSSVTYAYIQSDVTSTGVPRTGLSLWLRGEFGPVTSGSNVTQWSDLSGSSPANDATQGTGADQPTLVTDAVNGLSAVSFDGSSDYLSLASGLGDLTSGVSIFAVVKPTSTGTATIFTSGNSDPADETSIETLNTQGRFNAYNSTTGSSVTTPTSTFTVDKFQLFDAVHDGSSDAALALNTLSAGSGTVQNLTNTSRSLNYVGSDNSLGSFWQGELAELLVYSRVVSDTEKAQIEAYLFARYQLDTTTSTQAPVMSVPTGTLSQPQGIAIAASPGATVHVTLDGTQPTTSSPTYSGPVWVSYTQTVKALAVANGIESSVTSETYTLDSTKWPAPDAGDSRALEFNILQPTTAIPQ